MDIARKFETITQGRSLPPPLPELSAPTHEPWSCISEREFPPIMFQLRLVDGTTVSYCYSDLKEIHCRGAGHIELLLFGPKPKQIILQGRHLRELANWLGFQGVRWIQETNMHRSLVPESSPEITSISIEEL